MLVKRIVISTSPVLNSIFNANFQKHTHSYIRSRTTGIYKTPLLTEHNPSTRPAS